LYNKNDNYPQEEEYGMKRKILKALLLTLLAISFITAFCTAQGETVTLSKAVIRVLFSPQDDCAREIVAAIDKAERYVYVVIYFFTSRPIAQAIINAQKRGVDVRVCLDDEQPHYEYSKSRHLENNNINVRYVASKNSTVFHTPDCKWAKRIKEENKIWFKTREETLKQGYTPCKVCKP
jgi:phosphatidylserine/phosphatidylglycerophosphate/cardiolipin synthase-like enzyme